MDHGARTASKASGTKKLFAGIAAVGLAAGAYGVYATTLTIDGSAGTQLQAGFDAVDPATQCQVGALTVTENWDDNQTLDATTGYPVTQREGWTISGINAAGCALRTITLAVLSEYGDGSGANKYTEVGSTPGDAASKDIAIPEGYNTNRGDEGDTKGYSIKIS